MFDDLRELYQDTILERSRHPRHMHALDPFDAQADGDNPMCGDRVTIRLAYASNGTIAAVAFEGRGCAISLASADLMADTLRGRTPQQARDLAASFQDLARTGDTEATDPAIETLRPLSGVSDYPSRVKCATLPWHALLAALDIERQPARETQNG